MNPALHFAIVTTCMMAAISAQVPQYTVVPAAYATTDAVGVLWLPGESRALRQQEIVGATQLQSLVGKTLTAIEFRRNAQAEAFVGGTAALTMTISVSPNDPLTASATFANNVGPAPVTVFAGQASLPASPAQPGPVVPWTAANVVRVPFQTPFLYLGGTLCIDIVGTPVVGQVASWWPADAVRDGATGVTNDLGGGCGSFGGPAHQWSWVDARSLLPGGIGRFFAFGPEASWGLFALGTQFTQGWPLQTALPAAPASCTMFLGLPISLALVPFDPHEPGLGRADYWLPIPNNPALTGFSLTAQWVEWSQQASSNAIRWTVGGAPGLGMAHLDGGANDAVGELFVDLGRVMRFEHN